MGSMGFGLRTEAERRPVLHARRLRRRGSPAPSSFPRSNMAEGLATEGLAAAVGVLKGEGQTKGCLESIRTISLLSL